MAFGELLHSQAEAARPRVAMGGLIGGMNNLQPSDGFGRGLNTITSEQLR
jgi:hypothetical protein